MVISRWEGRGGYFEVGTSKWLFRGGKFEVVVRILET